MKVTVCFGEVRVLVPCGAGELLVRDLVREATLRYRKATGKGSESWVVVRNLRSETGGILDPDDQLKDVADDRETLVATLEGRPDGALHHGGDGASGSSVGTASPDLFRGSSGLGLGADMCGVEVGAGGAGELSTGGLQVRRGSEPTLNQDNIPHNQPSMAASKRWSAAVVFRDVNNSHPSHDNDDRSSKMQEKPNMIHNDSNKLHPHSAQAFQRQSNRLSMQFSGPGSGAWVDAAERIQIGNTKSLPRDSARKEPLGQDTSVTNSQNHRVEDMLRWVSGVNNNIPPSHIQERPLDRLPELSVNPNNSTEGNNTGVEVGVGETISTRGGQLTTVPLIKGERGLGFTITTRDNPTGGICPIYIKNILPKGAAVTDGRLRAGDRMVSVNGVAVSGLSQQQVVSLLRSTSTNSTVTIVVERPQTAAVQTVSAVHNRTQRVEPQPNYSKYRDSQESTVQKNSSKEETGRVSSIVNAINQNNSSMRNGHIKKSSSKDDLLHRDQINKSDQSLQDALNSSNTVLSLKHRSVMRLDIPVHDSEKAGLGISVKGKVTVGGNPQDLGIFIKSVLNGGAASRDGRLHMNDQLLNINGVSLVGQSNAEAMETLRRALVHTRSNIQGNISLTIARRTDSMDSIARWKDDTPPSVNESSNSNENALSHSRSFSPSHNTVIYNSNSPHKSLNSNNSRDQSSKSMVILDSNYNKTNLQFDSNSNKINDMQISNPSTNSKKHSSIVNINNNNTAWVNDKSEESRNFQERDNKLRESSERDMKRDSFEWGRLDGWNPVIDRLTGLRNESYCIATQGDVSMVNGGREHVSRAMHPPNSLRHNIRSPQPHHNVIIEEDYAPNKNGPGGVWESGSESGCGNDNVGFSRDAIGRRSMSEKRHAAMDAKNTGTYKKLKEQKNANNGVPVGPSLGMRKSSSLESLQTAIQEVSLHGHHNPRQTDPIYGRSQPLKHWLTDNGVDGIVRGTPTQSSLTHKKPSLLKSLSSMLGFGKQRPKISETRSDIYNGIQSRSHPGRASEKSISRSDTAERLHDVPVKGVESTNSSDAQAQNKRSDQQQQQQQHQQQHVPNGSHSRQSSNDRVADGGEDRVGVVRGMQYAPPYRHPPTRASPNNQTMSQVMDGPWGGGHYVNYEEIQHNLNARRERLSEVQIGQMRRQVQAQRVKAEEESRRGAGGGYYSQRAPRGEVHRPQSNYYEYESIQHARPINTKLAPYH